VTVNVPPNAGPAAPPDPEAAMRRDYELASRIGSAEALQAFLARHPQGFYSDLARNQVARLTEPKPEPPAAPIEGNIAVPAEFAGRTFTISATEVRDIVPGTRGLAKVRRQIALEIGATGVLKASNRAQRPDGQEFMNVRSEGRLGQGSNWKIQDGRLVGLVKNPGFHWHGTIQPTAKGCTATVAYSLAPGQQAITMTHPQTGQTVKAKSIRMEGIACTVKKH
jgi:hypothetical protein